MESKPLEICYQDEYFVAINKPHGLLVHRTNIATDAKVFAMQLLRDQLGQKVFPVHRLDRKTSGVLLFGLTSAVTAMLQQTLQQEVTVKQYKAIVRGYFPERVEVDYPLTNDRGKTQEAITRFECIEQVELPIPLGKHQTSRYSLIKAYPKTGRMHQIRKHCNHLRYPIIGDRPHGCNKQNRLFKERWDMTSMLLHAETLTLEHPITNQKMCIEAKHSDEFGRMLGVLEFFSSQLNT